MFMHDGDGDKEKEWWRCGGVYGFDVFVLFSFIRDEWAGMDIIRHWLNVRQGSYQEWEIDKILIVELKKEEQQGR